MKKFFAVIFSVALILCSCGKNDDLSYVPDTVNEQTDEVQSPVTGGEALCAVSGQFSGEFGYWWNEEGSPDRCISELTDDAWLAVLNGCGEYVLNNSVVRDMEYTDADDGSGTFKIRIYDDIKYNNGESVTARDFAAYALVALSPAAFYAEASPVGIGAVLGADDYTAGDSKGLSGICLIDEYTLSITVSPGYMPDYNYLKYLSLMPLHLGVYSENPLCVKDDGNGVYISGGELDAERIREASRSVNRISCGPYTLVSFEGEDPEAVLSINKYYKGNFENAKPYIELLTIKDNASPEDIGSADIIDGLSGSDALTALSSAGNSGYEACEFTRRGYGKLTFRCDSGSVSFLEVRQALASIIDKEAVTLAACGGYGKVIDFPAVPGFWAYDENIDRLNKEIEKYAYSTDAAVKYLESGGWTLNSSGEKYDGGIRYKDVTKIKDGVYPEAIHSGDRIIIPLSVRIAVVQGNPASDKLSEMLISAAETVGADISVSEISYERLIADMYTDSADAEKDGGYNGYLTAVDFGNVFDVAGLYSPEESTSLNLSRSSDRVLDELSVRLTDGVPSGDKETYSKVFFDYVRRWNSYVPEISIYANGECSLYSGEIYGYRRTAYRSFASAVFYSYVS